MLVLFRDPVYRTPVRVQVCAATRPPETSTGPANGIRKTSRGHAVWQPGDSPPVSDQALLAGIALLIRAGRSGALIKTGHRSPNLPSTETRPSAIQCGRVRALWIEVLPTARAVYPGIAYLVHAAVGAGAAPSGHELPDMRGGGLSAGRSFEVPSAWWTIGVWLHRDSASTRSTWVGR